MTISTKNRGMGDLCESAFSVFDPSCWLESPLVALGIEPSKDSLGVNPASCTSGTLQEQEACSGGVVAAQQQANADPAYACAMGSATALCNLGVTDANGNLTSSSWIWAVIMLGAGILVLKGIK